MYLNCSIPLAGPQINDAAGVIYDNVGADANIIFGAVVDEKLKDQISITVLATGFSYKTPGEGGADTLEDPFAKSGKVSRQRPSSVTRTGASPPEQPLLIMFGYGRQRKASASAAAAPAAAPAPAAPAPAPAQPVNSFTKPPESRKGGFFRFFGR
jgi:cell division protein FtsZ